MTSSESEQRSGLADGSCYDDDDTIDDTIMTFIILN